MANEWIKKICKITGCEEENVLTVPGNHDVDRKKINENLKDVHKMFKGLRKRDDIDYKIQKYVTDSESAKTLLRPFINYQSFAQKYGSIPKADNILFWEKDFNLDNSVLRIRGVNSAIVSNEDDDEHSSKLILGSLQSTLVRTKGVINIILCHHPPQWLYDGNDVHGDLKARAKIHLFGHKHVFDTEVIDNNCLVLSAGAMQPSRSESGWEPRYNIIELSIPIVLKDPTLKINLFTRVWKRSKKRFDADYSAGGNIYEEVNLALSEDEIGEITLPQLDVVMNDLNIVPMAESVIDVNAPDPRRKLAYMFLGLPYHIRLKIAVDMGLIEDSDRDLGEVQKAQTYFRRAVERSLLSVLWDKVANVSGITISNPFTNKI